MNNVHREIIWITGASAGIGAALARYYAKEDSCLGLVSRNAADLREVANSCRQKGCLVFEYVADVSDAEAMKNCSQEFIDRVGRIDVVIANAGIRGVEDEDYQDVRLPEELMRINYLGVINTFAPFIKLLKAQMSGRLVAISSIASYRGTPNSGAYSASKAAVNVWTESLRLRLIPYNISVSTICLGFVNTAMTEGLPFWMPGILSPEQAARMIAKRVENRSRTVTLPWQSRLIWGAFRMLPDCLYDHLIIFAKKYGPKR